jgi:predicted outer membrane repeat protein
LRVQQGTAQVSGCAFRENSTEGQGGGITCDNATLEVADCEFSQNSARWGGGLGANYSDVSVEHTIFTENHAWNGGALLVISDRASVTSCTFAGNSADVLGGAVYLGPAVAVLNGCTMSHNTVEQEGGALCSEGNTTLRECTIFASSDQMPGGAAVVTFADLRIENSIIAFGSAGRAVTCWSEPPVVLCSDFYGNAGGDWVGCVADQGGAGGNLGLDPLFCNPDDDDLTVREDSPCAPGYNPECGLIGSRPVGCSPPTPVSSTTWGRIKATFR